MRDSADAVTGTWSEFEIRRRKPGQPAPERTCCNTFITSAEVPENNVGEIARARWKIENEGCNCLASLGCNLKHNCCHGEAGLASLLAFHTAPDCVRGLWRQRRTLPATRRDFFENLRDAPRLPVFEDWSALPETLLEKRPLPALPS